MKSWIIAKREFFERISSRSFIFISIAGPILILGLSYILFNIGGSHKKNWKVLIADPAGIMSNKILSKQNDNLKYYFANGYIEIEEFAHAKKYQKFDALLEINEKILSNKNGFVFYREKPSTNIQMMIQYQAERRLEEVMIKQFTNLSVKKFREIKQPINLAFRNVYDPNDVSSDARGWVGFFFGGVIFVFIFLFGMTILRSVSTEKSNRIVEVLLGSVKSSELMFGKIIGIGLTALLQFLIWLIIVGFGLYLLREFIFIDLTDAANLNVTQIASDVQNQLSSDLNFSVREYNEFVTLIYERVNFSTMILFFVLFFLAGYLFYGAIFSAIGATTGSENDGQQFIIPLIAMLLFALYGGYYVLINPNAPLSTFFHYLPFTSPVVVMVKLAIGYESGEVYTIYMSLLVLLISAFVVLNFAGKLYKNGILQFGHRLKIRQLLKWVKS